MLGRAWKWAGIQREVADAMTHTWSEFVPEWRRSLSAYKRDRSKPNPFEEPDPSKWFSCMVLSQTNWSIKDIALSELKSQLAKEDSERRKAGGTFTHEITPSIFIQRALDIEAAQ
jgi:hypothetical protein